jgi:hypothetical protein
MPKAGLLRVVLRRAGLGWLEKAIPVEDFQQECALFLLCWSPEAVDADPKTFFRAAARHFYGVAVNYGFRRPKHSPHYVRQNRLLEPGPWENAEEDSDERKVAIRNWRSQPVENSLEFQERLEFCKRVLLAGNGSGKLDWYLFQGYLSGLNLNELAFLTLGEVSAKEVKSRLKGIISRIRVAAGIDPNLPLPPMPKKGEVEFRQGWVVNVGNQPNPLKPRQMAGDPKALANLSLKEIMARFRVSKATASRLRRRGWFVPDYHKK